MPAIISRPASVLAPEMAVTLPKAAKHICLDLETAHAGEDAVELAQEFAKPNSNIKDPEKALASMEEKRAKIKEKSALLDAAPISCLSLVTESEHAIFYYKGTPWPKKLKIVTEIEGFDGEVLCMKDEADMLVAARTWLDARAVPASIVIGFNIYGFDLPKLRSAYVRNRLVLPNVFKPEAADAGVETYDVMQKFLRYFTAEKAGDRYIKLEEVEARLGLPSYKGRVSGAEVPDMVAAGKAREVLTYCYLDTLSTYAAFRAMTGQYTETKQ